MFYLFNKYAKEMSGDCMQKTRDAQNGGSAKLGGKLIKFSILIKLLIKFSIEKSKLVKNINEFYNMDTSVYFTLIIS